MKRLALLSVLFLNLGIAQAADLFQYNCKSAGEKRGYKGVPVQIIVKELASAKKTTVGNWETETPVEVTILKETKQKGKFYVKGKALAKAYTEDVMYKIVSKGLGLSLGIFLDELENDPHATLFGEGTKIEVPLSCTWKRI